MVENQGEKQMVGNGEGGWRSNGWRIAGWAAAALVLLLPLLAMQFTDEVNWGLEDFLFAGTLLLVTGAGAEWIVRRSGSTLYRAGAGVALAAAFILLWISMSVGIIGRDGDPANFIFFAVLAVGLAGAFSARFRAAGMARAFLATAVVQVLVALIALVAGWGADAPNWPLDTLGLSGFFTMMWLLAAGLFWRAAEA